MAAAEHKPGLRFGATTSRKDPEPGIVDVACIQCPGASSFVDGMGHSRGSGGVDGGLGQLGMRGLLGLPLLLRSGSCVNMCIFP